MPVCQFIWHSFWQCRYNSQVNMTGGVFVGFWGVAWRHFMSEKDTCVKYYYLSVMYKNTIAHSSHITPNLVKNMSVCYWHSALCWYWSAVFSVPLYASAAFCGWCTVVVQLPRTNLPPGPSIMKMKIFCSALLSLIRKRTMEVLCLCSKYQGNT